MATRTQIGWTESSWNPWIGCQKVSPGCKHCYMFTDRTKYGQDPSRITRTRPTTFNEPISKKSVGPRMIFTCSWSDFFHETADPWRAEAWEIIRRTSQHTYQILTKRPERVQDHLPWTTTPWQHVWLGVSIETQRYADERIPLLLATTAAHRFLSVEPRLGPIDLRPYLAGIDWVIVGGESGEDFRPMEIAWAEQIVAACMAAGVPVFVKQDSGRVPEARGRLSAELWRHKVTTDDIIGFDPHEQPSFDFSEKPRERTPEDAPWGSKLKAWGERDEATRLLRRLEAKGHTFTLLDGDVGNVRPAPPADVVAQIKAAKPGIVAILKARP